MTGLASGRVAVPSSSLAARLTSLQLTRRAFMQTGQFVVFVAQTLWLLPVTLRRYRRQTLHAMNDLAWGRVRSSSTAGSSGFW